MHRLRSGRTSILNSIAAPQLKKKAADSWASVQDSFFSTKEIFENHKVVFTVGTTIASIATAWAGYSLRHYHGTQIDRRLEAIENAMKDNFHLEHTELKKLVEPAGSRFAVSFAAAGTTLVIGYGLGWRGGMWYANRKFRREQLRLVAGGQQKLKTWQLLGRIQPRCWPAKLLKRPLRRPRGLENAVGVSNTAVKDSSAGLNR